MQIHNPHRSSFRFLWSGALALLMSTQVLADGALAVNAKQSSQYGFAFDAESADYANSDALSDCGDGCSVVLKFKQCGAYAFDSAANAGGWAEAADGKAAQSQAVQACQGNKGSHCQVLAWGCNSQ